MSAKKILLIVGACFAGLVLLFLGSVVLAKLLFSDKEKGFVSGPGVGLVEVKGMIVDSTEPIRQLRHFAKKDSVKAVVLRIDSPGGVVGPSQEIYEEVRKLAARKKVVVSMGSLAASGGYYIAAPASVIYANPGTITASIGVLIKFSNLEGLFGKLGVSSTTIKTGSFKDAGAPDRPLSPEDRAMFQALIDSTHEQFVKAVAEGRKLPVDEVRRIADGRVLSGEQARALKLVDKLGNLPDAVEEAGRLAGISGEPALILPPKKKVNYLELLAEGAEEKFNGVLNKAVGRGLQVTYE
ncbi:signal peptide peptidase SppA [Trichlorobacter lovleyi]|uniref:signal peptide peptidase SppA n=1 Tax=Trichlorobacter lovleyi TaxID=313985 RepID=UPI00247FE140|nr:signal peptide peptidase SppA [Trichlorobacter lovleyi]